MRILETERLLLRPFEESDFEAVHTYASIAENIQYMVWGPNEESHTKAFILQAIAKSKEIPCNNYQYAAILKSSVKLIGACNIAMSSKDEAEIGWILHRDYWKQGFGTEMGKRILEYGFDELEHRIIAHCDTENYGSYRVMERIGMRREGCFLEGRPANKFSDKKYGNEYSYAILRDEWEMRKSKNRTIDLNDKLANEIYDLEMQLLRPEVRTSSEKLAELLWDDVTEFCSNGFIYQYKKNDVIEQSLNSNTLKWQIKDFKIKCLADDIILATYMLDKKSDTSTKSNHSLRSSIWKCTDEKWKMFFHQGTPVVE